MKTRQRKIVTKSVNAGTKQTKAKLPQYKAKKSLSHKKGKSSKCLTMNTVPYANTPDQGVPSSMVSNPLTAGRPGFQCNLKRKKKKPSNRESTDRDLDTRKHSMEHLLVSTSGDACLPSALESASKERKNLGSPVIVEALSDNLSSLSIPEAFRHRQAIKLERNIAMSTVSYKCNAISQKEQACVIVAQSVNPNASPSAKGNNDRCQRIPITKKDVAKQRNGNKRNLRNVVPNDVGMLCAYEERTENVSVDAECAETVVNTEDVSANYRKSRTSQWSSDANAPRMYCVRNKVVVVMEKKTRFCFTGKLILKAIYGSVDVYGSVVGVESGPIEVYSPRGYSSVAIETNAASVSDNQTDIWSLLSAEGISREHENKLVVDINQIQPGMAIILLSNFDNKLTKFLNVFYPFRLFPRIKNMSHLSWTDPRRAEVILQSNLYFGNFTCKELIVDPSVSLEVTEKMLNCYRANEWSCAFIAGGKGVGKSTTTRYLINNLLPVSKMVVLVDVDPGQTECTPPGCISYSLIEEPMMGPNFTHLKTPVYQLYIGDVNVSRCLTRYVEGIKMLVEKLSNCPILSRLPIVVNTMGFTHGIGWDIAIFTIKLIRPSIVVQIMSERSKNNYSSYLSKQVVNQQELQWTSWSRNVIDWSRPCEHELCVVRSHAEQKSVPGNEDWNMEPYQQRELVMISYFCDIARSPEDSVFSSGMSFGINEAVPYATPFSSLIISIPRACVPPSHVLNVVNGNIVALCGIDLSNEEVQKDVSSLRVLTRSPLCACYGFGIIRGVDMEKEEVFINAPLPASIMQHVNCVVGCIPMPVPLLQLNELRNVPYTGGNDVLPTSREHRRGYFRMRYPERAK